MEGREEGTDGGEGGKERNAGMLDAALDGMDEMDGWMEKTSSYA